MYLTVWVADAWELMGLKGDTVTAVAVVRLGIVKLEAVFVVVVVEMFVKKPGC
jgi:hypothetical protein